jgi:hypothetical protein
VKKVSYLCKLKSSNILKIPSSIDAKIGEMLCDVFFDNQDIFDLKNIH